MTELMVIARRELLDVRRNRFLAVLLGFLTVAVTVSVMVAAAAYRVKADDFAAYAAALQASGSSVTAAAPQLWPLQLLRGSLEYLELIGALFAIVLGYGVVARERQRGTLELVLTRPLGRYALAGGKVLALAAVWAVAVAVLFTGLVAVLLLVGHAQLTAVDAGRLLITAALVWVYLLLFSTLAMGLAAVSRSLPTGLVIALVLWLAVVLIIPQIGDTMDPDNQVPGGLFKSLAIVKADEQAVLAHFAGFDAIRNGLEASSVTKHVERAGFAFLGIKDVYNQQSIGAVARAIAPNILTLLAGGLAAVAFAVASTTRTALLRRQP